MTDRFTITEHEDTDPHEWRYTVHDAVSGLWCNWAVDKRTAGEAARVAPREWARQLALTNGRTEILRAIAPEAHG